MVSACEEEMARKVGEMTVIGLSSSPCVGDGRKMHTQKEMAVVAQ
jgi:hypothetical protein